MIAIKLVIVALVLFVFFGSVLLFAQLRRKKIKKLECGDEGEHSCSSCSCDRM